MESTQCDEIIRIHEQRLKMAQAVGNTGGWEFDSWNGMFGDQKSE